MTTYYKTYDDRNWSSIKLFNKTNNGSEIALKKYRELKNYNSFRLLVDKPLKIIVKKKGSVEKGPVDGLVDGNIFDLAYVGEKTEFNKYKVPTYSVKKIGLWDSVGHIDGPMTLSELKYNYDIYVDTTSSGGKTRRRRRVNKASRKSRRNRKR